MEGGIKMNIKYTLDFLNTNNILYHAVLISPCQGVTP